ncbi:uncharacterized protein BCR38DRAFT_337900 [Pseudomassariella vexata]|uniref:Stress-response A/B barrel domain-containing protein n=1 Tax=Pseudomassariella vexata TaxID=1141098 RepID=A0A1Y2E7C1_9PEZI|nr:uncharacterized protein BCR38DRAFT_337900 [Pseudomassariella vexata]ORY67442.1 hypothetical protein BCR38DRAFT_337900 [Pseudomassariella vexata]
MAPITRVALIAISDPAKQEAAVKHFSSFATECKKASNMIFASPPNDGAPYLITSKASKCTVVADKPGSSPWTVVATLTFANEADMEYFHNEDPVYKEIVTHMTEGFDGGIIAVSAEF